MLVNIAQIVKCTEAEGPGKRFALWFQGCPLRCPSCCNPEMLPFDGGQKIELAEICNMILNSHKENFLEGITFLGGEPTAHAESALEISNYVHEIGLNVMLFTGFLMEDLTSEIHEKLLKEVDILVDGPYNRDLPEENRRWIGSSNQRVLFLTDRCDPNDPRWTKKNTIEIRLNQRELSVNGFPAKKATPLWKRPRKISLL